MKKIILPILLCASSFLAIAHPPMSEKVIRIFNTSFPDASQVVWTEFENFYQVYFQKDQVHYRVYYDLNGNVLKSRSDYPGEKLNPFLTARLQKKFPGKKIFVVNEISTMQETFYLVNLEGENDWMQVRCDTSGNMEVVSRSKKG